MDEDIVRRAKEKLSLGRAYVVSKADYYSAILLEMTVEIVDAPAVTMGITRGLVLYVNGRWLLEDPEMQTDEAVGACLVHECEHPLRGLERLEALPNKEMANIAGDEAINYNLRDEGWKLPSWVVYPEKLGHPDNLTLEQYYELLQEQAQQQSLQQVMNNAMSSGSGQTQKGKQAPGQGKPPPGKGQADPRGTEPWQPKVGSGGCGSGGGNAVDPNLEAALDAEHGKSPTEVESARRQVLDDIEEALQSPGRGNVPGRFKEMIKTRNKRPDVNWRSVLRHILQRAMQKVSGASDYSISNPSVSSQLAGYIGAGLIDRQLNVVIVEDTSGSMGAVQLVQARNEAYHLMRRAGIDTATHIQVDTDVQNVKTVRLRDLPKLAYHGRGGTDFQKVFEYVKKKFPRTNLLVYFTDGDGYAPKKAPRGFATIWCIVRTPYARRPALWGHLVVCDKSQELRPPYNV